MPIQKVSEFLKEKGLESLYYLVHPDNLASICTLGILPLNEVRNRKLVFSSISNSQVQRRRECVVEGRSLHDYVPLYFVRRNPMLLAVSDKPRAYIRIALEVADKPGVIFTSGNAASSDTSFESGPFKVHIVHWDVLLSKRWTGRGTTLTENGNDVRRCLCRTKLRQSTYSTSGA
jgi:hypothetical protein